MFMEAKQAKTDLEFEKYMSKELFPGWKWLYVKLYTDTEEFLSKSTDVKWNGKNYNIMESCFLQNMRNKELK
jgi:hypothetical protein